MENGADFIYQAAFKDENWHGYADFLKKVDTPSKLGNYSYEVIDTKLKRSEDPKHLVQLVIYSNLLAKMQGVYPKHGHLVLGNDNEFTTEIDEVKEFTTNLIERFRNFVKSGAETIPSP